MPDDAFTTAPIRHVVNPRARRISLRIDATRREVVVVAPRARDRAKAEAFLDAHYDWVAERLAGLPEPRPFIEGGLIPIRGIEHRLVRPDERGRPELYGGRIPEFHVPSLPEAFPGRVLRALKALALEDLTVACAEYAERVRKRPARITVRDTKTRWGSCASTGEISFSWRLICAPPDVLDYVAAHEVAHLREANHSHRFWSLLEKIFGDSEAERDWLRDEGQALHAIGAPPPVIPRSRRLRRSAR